MISLHLTRLDTIYNEKQKSVNQSDFLKWAKAVDVYPYVPLATNAPRTICGELLKV